MWKGNITTLESDGFDWQDGKRLASLTKAKQQIQDKIDKSIAWYQSGRATKRTFGAAARYIAILLGLTAAALPTVSEMALKTATSTLAWWQRPGLATIIGVFAGGLLLLDRFAGGTSGWIRYTMAETTLKELRDELTFAWSLEAAQWTARPEPTVDEAKRALELLKGFGARLNQTIRTETELWKSEFQTALQQTDELVKAQPKKTEEAMLTVKLANPDRLAGKWFVSLNGGSEQEGAGDSKPMLIAPGSVIVRVRAIVKIGANGAQTEERIVEAGEMIPLGNNKTVSITLPTN